jgi:GT2 family glycosyltransferase
VVVNPSGDGTEEAIRREFPTVNVIRTHENLGFFPALNLAIANTTGDYIMTVDDDAYFLDPHAITRLVKALEDEPKLGAVTCNLEGPTETPITGSDRYIHVFTTGFTMVPRKAFTEWVGYYPDMFFRSGGETYLCTTLWDLGKRVKRLHNVRMYHERAMEGRSDRDWKFYGLRSQILCVIMREPWFVIIPSLLSKWSKSLFQFIYWGYFFTWVRAWFSALFYTPAGLRLRRPIRWRTQKLLWRLRKNVVSDAASLNGF